MRTTTFIGRSAQAKRNLRLFFALVVIVSASGFQQPASNRSQAVWSVFNSKEGAFAVLMPNKPVQEVQSIDTDLGKVDAHLAIGSHEDSEVFIASYTDLPSAPADESQIIKALDDVRDGQLKNAKGKLLSETTISLEGIPGRELKIETAVGPSIARIYLANLRLYQIVAVVPAAAAGSDAVARDTAKFLSSFKVIAR
jgi:hypothetical protein